MKNVGFAAAHWGMLIWAILIAASFFAAAQVSQSIDPILLTGLRLLFSALMFLPLLLLKNTSPVSGKGLLAHAVLGLLLATYFGSLFEALRYTSAVNTATLYTLVPLMTLLFEVFLLPNPSLKTRLLPMSTAAIGAVLLTLKGSAPGQLPALYPVLVFGAGCLAMALYSPLSQRFKVRALKGRDPVTMTFWNMLFGALFLLVFCLFSGGWRSALQLSTLDIGWLMYLAVFGTLATFWLLHRAIGVIAPSTVVSYVYLSTLFVTVLHWFWLRQQPLMIEILGAALVGIGMLALVLSSRNTRTVTA
ncbi:DMT family transporter [Pseudomonas sp. FP1154]|jgi:drug/metabolite transporter (DMT)-like permease|uniref:EamA/RhaT family transporter n=1 Tax=Pseudomonas rhizophila TaxID=2045200 RepID=A0ABN5JU81_9PSED|nr:MULTISPECIES: DMT family transporter [Pseudomonas]AVU75524.1 EamA/RhaT family transporter [Pseudomonas rhizophila]MBD0705246.1 EamA/RhaT family transporter [Pseudomonas sp. PSB1]MDD2029637.1 DMT family transporter [Pseudomonas sp. 39167]MDR8386966.1 DMT family transporter [Pseudomonas sp. JL2]MEA1027343.1 DMT family transporter [Pseudomonas sp. N-137]